MGIEIFHEKSLGDERTSEKILENKKEQIKEELEKITNAYLENADDKSLKRREDSQKKLKAFLENKETTNDERKLVNILRLRNGLEHLNVLFMQKKILHSAKTGDYSGADRLYKNTEEFDAQLEIEKNFSSKIPDLDKRIDIGYITAKAYPEYYDIMYEWERK